MLKPNTHKNVAKSFQFRKGGDTLLLYITFLFAKARNNMQGGGFESFLRNDNDIDDASIG